MMFWDSSGIIPLCLNERSSEKVWKIAKSDGDLVVWWCARVECLSALARRTREKVLSQNAERLARAALAQIAESWSEVLPTESVRLRAERLLRVHPLRAADSLQLAASLIWAEDTPHGHDFVCLDQNLCEAAFKEGFRILPG
jgi:predicted nucleic acid-binding protein